MISRRHQREIDGEPVLAVFRSGILGPLAGLTGIVMLLTLIVADDESLRTRGVFAAVAWTVGMLPILIYRRAAAIFTPDYCLIRPVLGRAVKLPLRGVKRAYVTEGDAPSLRVELLVGGEMDLNTPDPEAVAYLLNKGAGKGLPITEYRLR